MFKFYFIAYNFTYLKVSSHCSLWSTFFTNSSDFDLYNILILLFYFICMFLFSLLRGVLETHFYQHQAQICKNIFFNWGCSLFWRMNIFWVFSLYIWKSYSRFPWNNKLISNQSYLWYLDPDLCIFTIIHLEHHSSYSNILYLLFDSEIIQIHTSVLTFHFFWVSYGSIFISSDVCLKLTSSETSSW